MQILHCSCHAIWLLCKTSIVIFSVFISVEHLTLLCEQSRFFLCRKDRSGSQPPLCCSVVKHAGSSRARKKCRVKHGTQSSVFHYLLSALPLSKCFTTEQSTVEDLYLLYYKESNNFLTHSLNFQTKLYSPKEYKWRQPQCTVL